MSTAEPPDVPTQPPEPAQRPRADSLDRVEEVFFEVATIAPTDRDQAIARLCNGDAVLEREVRSLISAAGQLGSYLEQPALGKQFDQLTTESKPVDPPDELLGATLGSYTINSRIASGGMGTVYCAVRSDGQFDQRVAIKVVKRGMDSEEILRRFRTERQTLAALDHPNIARLIDGGMTPDGRPFVVMEFVEGLPIDAYCDRKGLGPRDRSRLFRAVCDGVHHAHQNLVIHRDIKPSNILVTPEGVPKLLDFGIAKVLSGGTGALLTHMTADTERRLTPEYASPEQVDGHALTTASDVYSLGVVLYELLTGSRPYHFGVRTSEEVRRIVCTVMPVPPSQAVTVKASRLRTDGPERGTRDRSIPTSPATAEPSAAGIDVPRTRGVSSTRLRSLLRGDLDTIVLMAMRKEPHRRYASAEQLSADIGHFLDGMPVQARKDTLAYRASKFVRRNASTVSLAAAALVLLTATTALLYHQGRVLQRQSADLLAANQRLTESRRFLQTVISGAGTGNQGPEARLGDVLRDAVTTLQTAPPSDPLTLAAAEEEMGRAMMSLGMLDEAAALLSDADRLYAALPPLSDPRMDSALSMGELAFHQGRYAEAQDQFTALLAAERSRRAGAPTERETALMNNLGSAVRAQGRAGEAIALQREALALTIAVLGDRSLEAAETRNNLASALFQRGDLEDAAAEFTRAYEVRRTLLRPGHPLIVRCQSNLGLADLRLGRIDEAVPLLTGAAKNWERAFGPEHPGGVAAMTSLAQALRAQHRFPEALQWLDRVLAWQRAHRPSALDQIAATEANIGITLAEQGGVADAAAILTRVLPQLRAGASTAGICRSATESLATIYDQTGEPEKARLVREQLPPR